MSSQVVAVEGDTAVCGWGSTTPSPDSGRWRDLWVLRFGVDGRCRHVEEWPFAPDQPDGH